MKRPRWSSTLPRPSHSGPACYLTHALQRQRPQTPPRPPAPSTPQKHASLVYIPPPRRGGHDKQHQPRPAVRRGPPPASADFVPLYSCPGPGLLLNFLTATIVTWNHTLWRAAKSARCKNQHALWMGLLLPRLPQSRRRRRRRRLWRTCDSSSQIPGTHSDALLAVGWHNE